MSEITLPGDIDVVMLNTLPHLQPVLLVTSHPHGTTRAQSQNHHMYLSQPAQSSGGRHTQGTYIPTCAKTVWSERFCCQILISYKEIHNLKLSLHLMIFQMGGGQLGDAAKHPKPAVCAGIAQSFHCPDTDPLQCWNRVPVLFYWDLWAEGLAGNSMCPALCKGRKGVVPVCGLCYWFSPQGWIQTRAILGSGVSSYLQQAIPGTV